MAMLAVLLAVSMATFDIAIVNTALPRIAHDLHTDAATSIWVVSAYQLSLVATLLPFASLGEIVGHRRVYLGGLVVFTSASILCALSWTLPILASARVLQGLGAAAVVSVNLALVRFIYPPHLLGRGVGMNALFVGASFTAGPSLASLILSFGPWPYLFFINVPMGVAAMFVGWKYLPNTTRSSHPFDVVAAVLAGMTFVLIVLGIDSAGHGGGLQEMAAEWLAAVVCLVSLLRRQSGHPAPMLALDLFRNKVFALSSLTSICAFATQGLAFVSLPFLFTGSLGLSQVEAGILLTPWPAIVASLAPVSGRMADRYSTGLLGGIGLGTLAVGMLLLSSLPMHPSSADIIWRLLLCGGGFGLFQAPNLKALMSAAPPHRSGGASGIVSISRNMGQASGAALVAVCFRLVPEHGPRMALMLGCGFASCAAIASLLRLAAKPPARIGAD